MGIALTQNIIKGVPLTSIKKFCIGFISTAPRLSSIIVCQASRILYTTRAKNMNQVIKGDIYFPFWSPSQELNPIPLFTREHIIQINASRAYYTYIS